MYSVSLILSTPIVRCTHMRFHRAFWRRFLYPGDLALYCLTLLLYVHTSCVSINICCKSLIRACEVASVLVKFLSAKCGCCSCLFLVPLLSDSSASISAVSASVSCWSVARGVYWINHMWRHWLLGLVGQLAQLLDLDLVLRCRLAPGAGKEMVFHTCVQIFRWPGWLDGDLHFPLWVWRFPRACGGLWKMSLKVYPILLKLIHPVPGFNCILEFPRPVNNHASDVGRMDMSVWGSCQFPVL